MQINPYLIFDGTCRDAFTTYEKILGGTVQLMTYGETPAGGGPPQPPENIMHAHLEAHGAVLMGSDGPGGTVVMPIAETFWALRFAMLKDRFGVSWMVNCSKPR